MSHRNAHYWLWFLVFGVVAGLLYYKDNKTLSSESIWLLVTGLLGILVAGDWLNNGRFAKPYDLIVGIIFAVAGVVGILLQFGLFHLTISKIPSGLISNNTLIGLSLTALSPFIHTVLGLTSINHSLQAK
jgi:peptidoglycan/LPS O-acetylase OafA/YrhL